MAGPTLTTTDLQTIASDPSVAPMLKAMPPAHRAGMLKNIAGAAARHASRKSGGSQMQSRTEQDQPATVTKLWNTYYSIVRFQAAVSVASPVTTLTFAAGTELRAFSYKIGDALTTAGFDVSVGNATEADTNLVNAGATIAGELVKVNGCSLMPSQITDIELFKSLEANMSVAISMNGDAQRYRLGRMMMLPGAGGVMGGGPTTAITPNLGNAVELSQGWSNGWPDIANFFPFPMPMIWSPSGETDSNFNLVLKLWRQVVWVETARAAASGVNAYTPPTAVGQFGTFVDVMVRLHSEQTAPRSVNQ
jgi:hypothetical protein